MKFSIVTPTRNNLDKLKRCVGSVRGQVEVDYEHIIQDAMSEDGTGDWLALQADITGVSESDGGMYDAINRGWTRSSGDILSWLNSDEQYLPGTLKLVSDFFAAHPDVDFLYGDALVVGNDGAILAARREIRLSRTYIANSFLNAFSCTTFFRRRLWEEGGLRLSNGYRYAADLDLILRLLDAGKCSAKIDHYLSAFTLDGTNLSCHPRMLEETAEIQARFSGSRNSLIRRFITLGRYFERWLSGSYKIVDVEYQFAVDEKPTYKSICQQSVSGSYQTR